MSLTQLHLRRDVEAGAYTRSGTAAVDELLRAVRRITGGRRAV